MTLDEPTPSSSVMRGELEVDVPVDGLSDRWTHQLATLGPTELGAIRIVSSNHQRVVFEQLTPAMIRFRRGTVAFDSVGPGRTQIRYAIEMYPQRWMMMCAVLFLLLGAVAIVAMFLIMEQWVIDSPNAAVRWQSLQSLQVVHFLWPPFLFLGLKRSMGSMLRARIEAMLGNLPYVVE